MTATREAKLLALVEVMAQVEASVPPYLDDADEYEITVTVGDIRAARALLAEEPQPEPDADELSTEERDGLAKLFGAFQNRRWHMRLERIGPLLQARCLVCEAVQRYHLGEAHDKWLTLQPLVSAFNREHFHDPARAPASVPGDATATDGPWVPALVAALRRRGG